MKRVVVTTVTDGSSFFPITFCVFILAHFYIGQRNWP